MASTTITLPIPGSRTRWLALGLAGGALIAAIASPAFAPRPIYGVGTDGTTPEHTISVTGTGRVVISPDVADLRVGVLVNRADGQGGPRGRRRVDDQGRRALKKLGIADKDIQTTTISLQPVYDYSTNTNPPRLTGYQLNNAVAVTVRDLDKVGDAIDGSLAAGATTFDGVSFRVEDPAKAEAQAREAAMAQAKAKAETLAKGAGVAIGGVASISETASPVPYPIVLRPRRRRRRRPRQVHPDPGRGRHERGDRHGRGELPHPVAITPRGAGREPDGGAGSRPRPFLRPYELGTIRSRSPEPRSVR